MVESGIDRRRGRRGFRGGGSLIPKDIIWGWDHSSWVFMSELWSTQRLVIALCCHLHGYVENNFIKSNHIHYWINWWTISCFRGSVMHDCLKQDKNVIPMSYSQFIRLGLFQNTSYFFLEISKLLTCVSILSRPYRTITTYICWRLHLFLFRHSTWTGKPQLATSTVSWTVLARSFWFAELQSMQGK